MLYMWCTLPYISVLKLKALINKHQRVNDEWLSLQSITPVLGNVQLHFRLYNQKCCQHLTDTFTEINRKKHAQGASELTTVTICSNLTCLNENNLCRDMLQFDVSIVLDVGSSSYF